MPGGVPDVPGGVPDGAAPGASVSAVAASDIPTSDPLASDAPAPLTRPLVTELRLSAFKSHRGATYPLAPLTLFAGPSGSGKSSALQAYTLLVRLGAGEPLDRALAAVPGGAAACAPDRAAPDAQGRRGFRIGCTVDGPAGPVRLDLAVQTEPELRVAGERLTGCGRTLFTTALTDPGRRTVQAAWHTAGPAPVTRAPLPDDRLGTALLPLRVAGTTAGQRLVLAAAEQTLIALRSSFPCDPRPEAVRAFARGASRSARPGTGTGTGVGTGAGAAGPTGGVTGGPGAPAHGTEAARLRPDCGNLAAVLDRTSRECATRHAALVDAVRTGCSDPVDDVRAERPGTRVRPERDGPGDGVRAEGAGDRLRPEGAGARVRAEGPGAGRDDRIRPAVARSSGGGTAARAVLERGGTLGAIPVDWLGDGELRYLALALVLLTGPGVLAVDPVAEVLPARQVLTVVADGLDRCLDRRQSTALLELAVRMAARGHVRLLGTVTDATAAARVPGIRVLHLGA
ncbi:biotin transporter BioY [Streptomyces sp. Ru73]|uniref:biotin transporter BioY n=1 Tax=Streptomyces sp. Ru73 TaxID=2080748 RepID=UPI0035BC4C25